MVKKNFINFIYTFGSNIITLLVSVVVTLVLPKRISVSEYSLVQLYTFYSTYIGITAFGLPEGMLVNYAGKEYDEVNKEVIGRQVQVCTLVECVFMILFCVWSVINVHDIDKSIVCILCAVSFVAIIPRLQLLCVFQATSRFKEYANGLVIEKIVYLIGSVLLMALGVTRFYWYVVAIIFGYICSMTYCIFKTKDLFRFDATKSLFASEVVKEIIGNISVGSKILFATLSGNLIIGFVRMGIEGVWSVEIFGRVSLTISIANLLMVFINAVATIMLPALRRASANMYEVVYSISRSCIMVVLLGALVFYQPIKTILSLWLPDYAESLRYMAILFPMCVFSSKSSMLIEPYLKALHREKWLLIINIITVLFSGIVTLITTCFLHNLDLAVASIVFLLAFRCIFAELLLSTVMNMNVKTDIMLEVLLTTIFIIASWFIGGIRGFAIYASAYLVYLFVKRKDIIFVANKVLCMVRHA